MKYKKVIEFGSYKGHSIFSVAKTRGNFTNVDYFLDPERNILLHINSRAGIVFLEQPVDFVHLDCVTNTQKANYVRSYRGFVPGEYPRNTSSFYCVYTDHRHTCFLEREHTLAILDNNSCRLEDCIDMQYTEHDTLQTVFDRARIAARCFILADNKRRYNTRKNLPEVSEIN